MSNITQIDSIPIEATLCRKGMKSKKIYLNGLDEHIFSSMFPDLVFAVNDNEEINVKLDSGDGIKFVLTFSIYKDEIYKDSVRIMLGNDHGCVVGSYSIYEENYTNNCYLIEMDSPVEILYDAHTYIYCIEEKPPEIIPIDKAPTTTSLNDITNYINKTTESIKSCKSYIAYVINNKGGSATDTETLESLIENLNETFHFSPDDPTPPLEIINKPFKLKSNSSFEDVSTKLQEINNLLKVSSDNLKTIMDANSLMYEPTDNFSTLVQKCIVNKSPDTNGIDV